MLPLHKIIWHEWLTKATPLRVPEPTEAMEDMEQIRSYVKAYEWGGPTSALQFYHLKQLSKIIRPGDTVLDLACGPGPLLLELARIYPDCRFIGTDLSQPMLAVLQEKANAEALSNIETRCEDVRHLNFMPAETMDIVISTSALHHLPDTDSLRMTLQCAKRVKKNSGYLYFFDFGLIRSKISRDLLVAEVAKSAPPITARDYELSLQAAFPVAEVNSQAAEVFGDSVRVDVSNFIDFFYFIRTRRYKNIDNEGVSRELAKIWKKLDIKIKVEYLMLQKLQRRAF